MIQTWIADVTPLMDNRIYENCFRALPVWRQEKAKKLRSAPDKALSVGAWTLYEQAVAKHQEIQAFNLSHSGKYALCSFVCEEDCKVGCDVQEMRKVRDSLAKRFFTEKEYEYISMGEIEQERTERFYRLWVLKESFAKATKEGLQIGLANFEVGFDSKDMPVLLGQPQRIQGQYYFKEYSLENEEYKIAVCALTNQFAEELKVVKLGD